MSNVQQPRPITFATPDNRRLRGFVMGEGALDVVFTPGNGFTAETYLPALRPLADSVRLHALNASGQGASDDPGPFSDWLGFVADLRAYVEAHTRTPVVLAGHSFGAVVSLALAGTAPALVRGLLLMEPLVRGGRHEDWHGRISEAERAFVARAAERRDHWPSREEADDFLKGRGGYRGWAPEAWAPFVATGLVPAKQGGVRLACPPWLEAAIYGTVPNARDLFGWADSVTVPGAVLYGRDSAVVSPGGLAALVDTLPAGVLYAVRGTHAFPMERPHEAGRVLADGLAFLLRCAWNDAERDAQSSTSSTT